MPLALGERIRARLRERLAGCRAVTDIRGNGLMIGIELDRPCGAVVAAGLDAGILINVTADKVVRLLPPLVMSDAEADELVDTLATVLKAFLGRLRIADENPETLSAVQGFQPRRIRVPVRACAPHQAAVQGLPEVLAAGGSHAGDDLREGQHAYAPVFRGRHASTWRFGDLSQHARFATRARRTGRGCGGGDFAHERCRDDPHLRAGDHRALCQRIRACR